MKIELVRLTVTCKRAKEVIPFTDFTYFYGKMGAGKSSIVRMIDFCFGGDLEMTPALQNELVSVGLSLKIAGNPVHLERSPDSGSVRASWTKKSDTVDLLISAKTPTENPVFGKDVYVLSDLLFYLADKSPPKVRRSKLDDDSPLQRLSFRDLFWYCYLDQDSLDSSFFNLELDTNPFKKLKSLDVLRLLVGFHQAEVSSLQVRLQEIRIEKDRAEGALAAMRDALDKTQVGTPLKIAARRAELGRELAVVENRLKDVRNQAATLRSHALNEAQAKARALSTELEAVDTARTEARVAIEKDREHRNEMEFLAIRFKRAATASAVLRDVQFSSCPKCTQKLPHRAEGDCTVCGQMEPAESSATEIPIATVDADTAIRIRELDDMMSRQNVAVRELDMARLDLADEKARLDDEISRLSDNYDSAYLSNALELERHRASLAQEILNLNRFEQFLEQLAKLDTELNTLVAEEAVVRKTLRAAQVDAEKDTTRLTRLRELFLDSLLRAKIPGFGKTDVVEMKPPHFLPEITGITSGDLAVTSFTNLGSGGKKVLFKCCFAVAVHRLAAESGALLPTLLIIDSPMKNISERENIEQFDGFYKMLYELSQTELKDTQFLIVDKERQTPGENYQRTFSERYRAPNDPKHPGLISYYAGH